MERRGWVCWKGVLLVLSGMSDSALNCFSRQAALFAPINGRRARSRAEIEPPAKAPLSRQFTRTPARIAVTVSARNRIQTALTHCNGRIMMESWMKLYDGL